MYRFLAGATAAYLVRNVRSGVAPYAPIPTSATGTLTVRTVDGALVLGQSWPAPFAWDAALNGFAGRVQGSLEVFDRRIYVITATLDGGPGALWQDVEEMRAEGSTEHLAEMVAASEPEAPLDLLSVALSTVAVSDDAITQGDTITLTLTARLASGTPMAVGGLTVVFTQGGGTSAGTISATTDVGDGTYTATFLATDDGTATTIGATMDGVPVTSTLSTVTVSAQDAYDTSGAIDPSVCFFSTDWTEVANTADLLTNHFGTGNDVGKRFWQVTNPTFGSIDNSVPLAGHHVLKHTLPGGGSAATLQPKVVFRNALCGGDGTTFPPYDTLWWRIRHQFDEDFNLQGNGTPSGSARSFKVTAFGYLAGSVGHIAGRSTLEFDGDPSNPTNPVPTTLKIGLDATPGADNYHDIVLNDVNTGAIGTQFTDGQWRDTVGCHEFKDDMTYRVRVWRALTGAVPTRICNLTGAIVVVPGHEGDPKAGHETHGRRPTFDRWLVILNSNMNRDDPIAMRIGSLELVNGAQHANPFKLPAQELL